MKEWTMNSEESDNRFKKLVKHTNYEGYPGVYATIYIKFPWDWEGDERKNAEELRKKIMRLDVVQDVIKEVRDDSEYDKLRAKVLATKDVASLIDLHVELNKEKHDE
jgi:hypothetical protein